MHLRKKINNNYNYLKYHKSTKHIQIDTPKYLNKEIRQNSYYDCKNLNQQTNSW